MIALKTIRKDARKRRDSGAVAVEFALVLPLLLALILGIATFASIYNAQVLLTNGARDYARVYAISGSSSAAQSAANAATPGYSATYAPTPAACPTAAPTPSSTAPAAPTTMTVNGTATVNTLFGSWFGMGATVTLKSTGAMPCGG
jgi:Flp pilus assembly protein TadG